MPVSSPRFLKKLLVQTGVLPAAEALFWFMNRARAAKIIGYHRILDNGYFHRSRIPPETLMRRFAEQIRYLSTHFRIVPLRELVACVREGRPLPQRCMAVTFDDGYRDLLTVGQPILARYRVPVTCFLATHYTETNRIFPFDTIAFALDKTRVPSVTVVPGTPPVPLGDPAHKGRAMFVADRYHKSLHPTHGARFLERFVANLEVTVPETYTPENGLLNWDEVRELSRAGNDFQAHSASHSPFSVLTQEEMEYEALEPRRQIEKRTERPVNLFCYPGGREENQHPLARAVLERCGYRAAVVGDRGAFRVSDDPYRMKRYMVDSDLRTEELAGRISELFNPLQGRL